ncbi:MAG TPA: CBS domain-containing protein, partial [Albitalea sp.]|nr:CBS domain-containing protein [Albitalea sp.]
MSKAPPEPKSAAAAQALRSELVRVAPFAQMDAAHVDRFIANARPARYAAGDTVLSPQLGVVQQLHFIRHGSVSGRRGMAEAAGGFEFEAGDLFPVGAVVGARPVTATYTANEDTLCLLLPAAEARQLAADSAPFADFLNRRVIQLLELSQRALQVAYSSQTLAEQSLDTPLSALARRPAVVLRGDAPLAQALALIHERHIGSVVVVDADGAAQGILTRHDVIGRVALAQLPLATPVAQVMTAPV